jgi:hypothetical protein
VEVEEEQFLEQDHHHAGPGTWRAIVTFGIFLTMRGGLRPRLIFSG